MLNWRAIHSNTALTATGFCLLMLQLPGGVTANPTATQAGHRPAHDTERTEPTPAGTYTAQKGGGAENWATVRVTVSNVSDFEAHDQRGYRNNGTGFTANTDGKQPVSVHIAIDAKGEISYQDYNVALTIKATGSGKVLVQENRQISKDGGSTSLTFGWNDAASHGGLSVQARIVGGNPETFAYYVDGTVRYVGGTPYVGKAPGHLPPGKESQIPSAIKGDTRQIPEIKDTGFRPESKDTGVRFAGMNGQVEVRHQGETEWDFADLNTVVTEMMEIKTARGSSAVLSFSDMSTFVMKPETLVVISTEGGRTTKLGLVMGNIWVNVKKMWIDGSLEIEMNQGICGIKGTTIVLEEDGRISRMKVIEGRADFKAKADGRTVELSAGQMVAAGPHGLDAIQNCDTAREADDWQALIAATLRSAPGKPADRGQSPVHTVRAPTQQPPHIRLDVAAHTVRPGDRIVVVHSEFPISDRNAWIGFYDSFAAGNQDYLHYTFLVNLTDRTFDVIAPDQPGREYHFRIFPTEGNEHGVHSKAVEIK